MPGLVRILPTRSDPAERIAYSLGRLFEAGEVLEISLLEAVTPDHPKPHTMAGYFDDPTAAAQAVASIPEAKGFNFTLNPVDPALLPHAENQLRPIFAEPLTADSDILVRRWLLIRADPVRPAGVSSTDEEHQAALERVRHIQDALRAEGRGQRAGRMPCWPTAAMARTSFIGSNFQPMMVGSRSGSWRLLLCGSTTRR